jgi:hypothetical protein
MTRTIVVGKFDSEECRKSVPLVVMYEADEEGRRHLIVDIFLDVLQVIIENFSPDV